MKEILEVTENNNSTFTLPSWETLNCLFSHNGDGIIQQTKEKLPGRFNSFEHNILFNIIGNYISDVNLTSEERIYKTLSGYIDNKLINFSHIIEKWILDEFAPMLQNWLENEFSKDLIKKINEKTNSELNSDDLKTIVHEYITSNKFR